jgi:hypothetical protein
MKTTIDTTDKTIRISEATHRALWDLKLPQETFNSLIRRMVISSVPKSLQQLDHEELQWVLELQTS